MRKPPNHLRRHRYASRQSNGPSKIETTKNIYGHLFAQDRAFILEAMNQAVIRLYVEDDSAEQAA